MSQNGSDLIVEADLMMQKGRHKDAHILFGKALANRLPSDVDRRCRFMRGICSRLVAQQRLIKASNEPDNRQSILTHAAKWLCKSEANLDSALETATGQEQGSILLEQAETERAIAKFMEMWGNPDNARRLANAARFEERAKTFT